MIRHIIYSTTLNSNLVGFFINRRNHDFDLYRKHSYRKVRGQVKVVIMSSLSAFTHSIFLYHVSKKNCLENEIFLSEYQLHCVLYDKWSLRYLAIPKHLNFFSPITFNNLSSQMAHCLFLGSCKISKNFMHLVHIHSELLNNIINFF